MKNLLAAFNQFLLVHATGRWIWSMLALAIVSFVLMAFVIAPEFSAATGGLRPFDMNFGIGAEIIYRDLPAYTDRARELYVWFALVDFVYPLALAAFFALLWAWWFKRDPAPLFVRLMSLGALFVPFVFAIVDWLENFGFLFVIFSYPAEYPGIANLAGALKALKPTVELIVLAGTFVFLAVYLVRRRARNARSTGEEKVGGLT